jgi:hypothetical protein
VTVPVAAATLPQTLGTPNRQNGLTGGAATRYSPYALDPSGQVIWKGTNMEAQPDMAMGAAGCVFTAIFGLVALAALAFWVWMLIDAISRTPSEGNTKLIWILVIVLTGIIGALIYFFVQRPKNPPKT